MARPQSCLIIFLTILFSATLLISVSAKLDCEDLPVDLCAFAVSSNGARCVLEKKISRNGDIEHECQTSIVTAEQFPEWVETDDCVKSCGLQRMSVGMSSDALVENELTKTLCSDYCRDNCPNVIDLYTKLAAGEGASLSQLCQDQYSRRMMGEMPTFASKSANTLNFWEASSPSTSPVLGSKGYFVTPTTAPVSPPSEA